MAFPIRVGLPAVPRGSFVRVRGLPPAAALSDGHSIAPGAWAVPMAALPDLKITLPASVAGRAEIVISLVAIDGSVLGEAKSSLVIAAVPASAPPAQGASLPPDPVRPARTTLTPEDRERTQRLIKRANELLADGAIAQARLLYERAADAGLALGAMAMAATYDAVELNRMGVLGLKPDREAARRWYERARQLGAAEAEVRLQQLGAR